MTDLEARLARWIDRCGPEDCWPWMGYVLPSGYGQMTVDGLSRGVHRVVWEHFNGRTLRPDETVDHDCHSRAVALGLCGGGVLCPHRRCQNPAHLVAMSKRDNVLLGNAPTALNARKTHCPKGHPYQGANVYVYKGWRQCRECAKQEQQKRRDAKAAS